MSIALDNTGTYLQSAINSTTCKKHNADIGIPCWTIRRNVNGGFGYYGAICGMRISKAGFNGKITSASMRTKAPTKNKDGERKPFKKKLNSRTQSFSSK